MFDRRDLGRIGPPILVDHRVEHLPAGRDSRRVLFLQQRHALHQTEAIVEGQRPRGRKRRVPTEGVAADGDHVVTSARGFDVEDRLDVDQRRHVGRSQVTRGLEARCAVQSDERLQRELRAQALCAQDERVPRGQRAQGGLGVRAAARAEDHRARLLGISAHRTSLRAASAIWVSETRTTLAAAPRGTYVSTPRTLRMGFE